MTYRMISDFQRLYATLGENNPSLCAEDPRSGVLCELYKISKTKYLRLNTLSLVLSLIDSGYNGYLREDLV